MIERYSGRWSLARSIADLDAASAIACTGTATLLPSGGALAYAEAVSYRLGARVMRATRDYRFACEADGTVVATFSDGAPFFRLRLDANGHGSAVHDCGDDRYALELDASQADRWATSWVVTGTKRLHITTHYTPLP